MYLPLERQELELLTELVQRRINEIRASCGSQQLSDLSQPVREELERLIRLEHELGECRCDVSS